MPTLEKIDGFEHGNPSTGANGVYDVGASTQVATAITTSQPRTALRSLQCEAPSADTCNVGYNIAGNVVSMSFYIRISTGLPNNNAYIAAITNATSGGANIQYGTGTGKFNIGGANFTGRVDFGPVIAIDTWYRIDIEYDTSATPAVLRAMVDGADEGTHTSNAITPANSTEVRLGATTSSTWGGQHHYDDWVVSITDGDYPLGEYQIESLIPSSDGTHNITTSGDFDSFVGTAFSNSTTNGNTFIGHRPQQKANTADQVIRQELGTTSNYMEFGLEDHTLSGTPLAARCYACYVEAAASGASLAEQRLYLADGTTEVLSTGSLAAGKDTGTDPGTTVSTSKRMLIAPSGGWDNTKIDGLLARVGYGDNAPDVNFIDFMIEVAYQPTVAGAAIEILAAQYLMEGNGSFDEHEPVPDLYAVDAGAGLTTMDVTAAFFPPAPFEEAIEVLIAADPIPHQQSDYEVQQPRGPPWDQYAFPDQIEWRSSRVTLNNTAEGGVDGVEVDEPISGGASGTAWDIVTSFGGGSTAVYFDAIDQHIDSVAYRFETFADFSNAFLGWTAPGAGYPTSAIACPQPQLFARFYFWTGSVPNTGQVTLFLIQNTNGDNILRGGFDSSRRFFLTDTVDTATSAVEPLKERWVRIEVYCDPTFNYAEMRYYMDPNAGAEFPTNIVVQDGGIGSLDVRTIFFGWLIRSTDGDEPLTFFMDNIGIDNVDFLGPLGTAPATDVPPSTPAIQPYDVVQPWERDDFRQWEHETFLGQNEWLSEVAFAESIENLIAAQPVFEVNPHPNPDFFIWDHRQQQPDWLATPITINNTAEGGVLNTDVTEANSGGASGQAWDDVSASGGHHLFFNDDQRVDTLAYRFDTVDTPFPARTIWTGRASASQPTAALLTPRPQLYARFYVWTGSYPSITENVYLLQFNDDDATFAVATGFNENRQLLLQDRSGTSFHGSYVFPKEQWVRVEVYCKPSVPEAEVRVWTDPNSVAAADASVTRAGSMGALPLREVQFGQSAFPDQPLTFFMDNLGVSTETWMGPLGTAPATTVPPSTPAVIHPYDVVMPWPTRVFEEWDHRQEQAEHLFPFIPPLITIEDLIAADMFSSGDYPSRPVEPTDTFQTYDQNPDPAPMIPPGLTGLIRRVPRWAKHGRYFLPGGRFP